MVLFFNEYHGLVEGTSTSALTLIPLIIYLAEAARC